LAIKTSGLSFTSWIIQEKQVSSPLTVYWRKSGSLSTLLLSLPLVLGNS